MIRKKQRINQPEALKNKLLEYIAKYPRTINWYAEQIGVTWTTLNSFLYKGRWAHTSTMIKMTNYLTAQGVMND